MADSHGDNIYMDYSPHLNQSRPWTLAKFAAEMQRRYALQFAVPSFRQLVRSIPAGQVIGVWDDHDFAWNNCFGAEPTYGMVDRKKVVTSFFHHYFAELNKRPLATALPQLAMPNLQNPPNGTARRCDSPTSMAISAPTSSSTCATTGRSTRECDEHRDSQMACAEPRM